MASPATKPRDKARSTRAPLVSVEHPSNAPPVKSTILVDGVSQVLIEVRGSGDVILEVAFENTAACNKSIPADKIKELRVRKCDIPSPKMYYRVDLETLKKNSKYFSKLLGSDVFGEGVAIKDIFSRLRLEDVKPSTTAAEKLPRVPMVNDELGTRTLGREMVFLDLLRVLHGEDHVTKPVTLLYLSVLVSIICI